VYHLCHSRKRMGCTTWLSFAGLCCFTAYLGKRVPKRKVVDNIFNCNFVFNDFSLKRFAEQIWALSGLCCDTPRNLGDFLPKCKGDGTSVAVLHLFDSFHQKCSKLGTYTPQDLKNNFYFRGFSISSGPDKTTKNKITNVFYLRRFFLSSLV
jgi:hypothetical protein